jgi:uncharacterized protein
MSTLDANLRDTDDPLVSRLEAALAREASQETGGIVCAWLFGSRARGTARPTSDLDVAILFSEDPPRTLAGLHLDLADRLTGEVGRAVDLVVLNRAPVDLVHRVLRDGILLLEHDRSARIRFEVRARNEYFDLLPHLLRYRRGGHRAVDPGNEDKRS